jgi:hypothetical protein
MKKVLVFVHLSLVLIFIIGPFLPGKYLLYYLFLWPLVYIHWYFNDDRCMLTELEYNNDTDFFSSLNEYSFFSKDSIFTALRKINIFFNNEHSFHISLDKIRTTLWIVAFIRAIIYYRKDIVKWLSKIRKHFIFRFLCDSCKS